MTHEKWVRTTLALSVPFNFIAAYGLWQPTTVVGQILQAPAEVPAVYAALLAYLIALFGVFYGYMAQENEITRPLLFAGVTGKTGVFVILALLWLQGEAPFLMFLVSWGDLAFAGIWGSWLWRTRAATSPQTTS